MVKFIVLLATGIASAFPVSAAPALQLEVGASYFSFRQTQLEFSPEPLALDETNRMAPLVGLRAAFTDRFSVRLSYQRVDNVRATAQFGYPPGNPSSPLPIVVWGHYEDDIHTVSLAAEYTWAMTRHFSFSLGPQLNWVASRGTIRYATDSALILLMAPHERNEAGFTWGGAARVQYALSGRASLFASYQFIDLAPSFERQAHVVSAGLTWKF